MLRGICSRASCLSRFCKLTTVTVADAVRFFSSIGVAKGILTAVHTSSNPQVNVNVTLKCID